MGSDRYKSENMSTQLPEGSVLGSTSIIDKPTIKAKDSQKKWFGIIPTVLIKQLEPSNLYEDRIRAITEISQKYVEDDDNFESLIKNLNKFVAYLFGLSHEDNENEDESLAYEAIGILNKILNKNIKYLSKLDYKLCFSNLIDHSKTLDKALLNEVIAAFKKLKEILGEAEYSKYLQGYLDIPNHSHMGNVLDVYSIIFEDMKKLPKRFDYESTIKALSRISKNNKDDVGQKSSQMLDKIFKLLTSDDKKSKAQAYKLLEQWYNDISGLNKGELKKHSSYPTPKKTSKSMYSNPSNMPDKPLNPDQNSTGKLHSLNSASNLKISKKSSLYSSNVILSDKEYKKVAQMGRKEMLNIHSSMGRLPTIEEKLPPLK